VLIDLHHRAEGGIPVHLAAWLLVVGSSGLYHEHLPLASAIGALFLLIALARLVLRRRFQALVRRRYRLANRVFLTLLLSNGAIWGLLAGISLHWPVLMPAHELIRLVTFATCAGGTIGLALVPVIRIGMPALMMGPLIIAMLVRLTADSIFLALMTLVFLAYIGKASRTIKGDYWSAIAASRLLAERALELERLSITDALTQVHNRLYFDRRIAEEWARAQRDGETLTVLMIDLDRFKEINDAHGHPVGDRCLREVAAAVRGLLYRPGDVLARYGGEEFAVLLTRTSSEAGAIVAERLRLCVQAVVVESPRCALDLSCSIGCATAEPAVGHDWPSLIAAADAAMYAAKARGRNRVVVAGSDVVDGGWDVVGRRAASGG
jgi:diguanylate cyclase (GGDEF)-like protein